MRLCICTADNKEYGRLYSVFDAAYIAAGYGLTCVHCPTGEDFYAKHVETPFDVVVSCFAGASGQEVVLWVKERTPDCRVLWITSDQAFGAAAFRAEVEEFLTLPYTDDQLAQSVNRCLFEKRRPPKGRKDRDVSNKAPPTLWTRLKRRLARHLSPVIPRL